MNDTPALTDLLLQFESFGDNCEFGVMQRQAGIEPLGLLRFAYSPMRTLLLGLNNRFSGVGEPKNIEIDVSKSKEFIVRILGYDISYHTRRYEGEIEIETLRRDESIKQRFLVRRLFETLAEADKIIVRRGPADETLDDAKALLAALRRHGPVTLLWVTQADAKHPPRSVRLAAPNLIHGRLGRLAPYDDAHNLEFSSWADVCRAAYALWKSDAAVGTVLRPADRDDHASNLLLADHAPMTAAGEPAVTLMKHNSKVSQITGSFPLREKNSQAIFRVVKQSDEQGAVGLKVAGLTPGQVYTFSLWVRLEPGGAVKSAQLLFPGCKTERTRRPSIKSHEVWQQLDVSAIAPPNGVMFPRLLLKGDAQAAIYVANWRLEAGLIVGETRVPGTMPPPPMAAAEPLLELSRA